MKINYLGKKRLSLVLALGAASVAFAQTDKDSTKSKDIEQVVLTGVADIAKERKTPVAVSTIKEAQIIQKLGNQEFPEILATTPSVYATKGGGGFGDGRINIRGFANENIAVMINGVPVNDMEGGTVYWSNWAGLSDVTSAMQVQRGLGASKLAIASVGGTINVVTRAADKKREGNVTLGLGNDGYLKTLFSYNTGLSSKGWATSFLMSRTAGSMYFDGSSFEGYNYYFAVGYKPSNKHEFQFTFTGAPQWHNQNFANTIATDIKYGTNGEPNRKYNSNWGYLNGEEFSQTRNHYSKPVMSVNWDWKLSEKSKLSTVLYASWGRGGGTGALGSINGKSINSLAKTADGLIRFDDIVAWNKGGTGAPVSDFGAANAFPSGARINNSSNGITMRSNINSHDWYGILSNFNHKVNSNLNYSLGIDARYYYGYHPGVVTNLLGADGYLEKGDKNQPSGYLVNTVYSPSPSANPFVKAVKSQSDIVNRNYNGEVRWIGAFGQLEYSTEKLSAFFQGSLSDQGYQRIDNWIIDGVTKQPNATTGNIVYRKTGFKNLVGYNAKGGINYNIDDHSNVFGNIGYYEKQPFLYNVYPNNQQVVNPALTNEKIFGTEIGYGFKSSKLRANVNLYRTSWKDRFVRLTGLTVTNEAGATVTNAYANMEGVEQLHMGVEFDASYEINQYVSVTGMFSAGNWKYHGNANGQIYDENNNPVDVQGTGANTKTLAIDGVKVSDAAQTTAALGLTVKPVKALSVFGTWRYAGNLYSVFNFTNYIALADGSAPATAKGALKLPDYNLFDLGASYTLKMNNDDRVILSANVYNLFDTVYISDGKSSIFGDDKVSTAVNAQTYEQAGQMYKGIATANSVYFGFGRTWAASISYRF